MYIHRYTYIGVPRIDPVLRADPRRKRVRVVRLHPRLATYLRPGVSTYA